VNVITSGSVWVFLSVTVLLSFSLAAQPGEKRDHDTSFYRSYREKLTARVYLSRKYTVLTLHPPGNTPELKYRSNTSLNTGIGVTYRAVTLNLGFGLNSFNPGAEKGSTHYLDLQTHIYARKWSIDLFGQFYKGYFLSPKGLASPTGSDNYYIRPDLAFRFVGAAVYRALNDDRFSYQAGLVQNEWQRKSAGSILVGGESYYGALGGDSSLVPHVLDSGYSHKGIDKVHFFKMGPGAGYVYTLVIRQHFFLLASATINLDLGYSREEDIVGKMDRIDFRPDFLFRAGAGYNAGNWAINLLWVGDEIHLKGAASGYSYQVNAGNYRLIYARRLALPHRVRKVLAPVPG
jgi:hypothetical protein